MNNPWQILADFFPPELSAAYLRALISPMLETLGLALGAMTIVYLISLPLALAMAVRARGARALITAISIFRAIPDLTLAIFCVILFGVGPGAGLLALVIYYTAAVAKVFGDLLITAPRAPLDALAATGASRAQIALYGLLPLTRAELLNYGAFAFECALRAAVIVGAVGGGGLGAELSGALALFDFPRAATLILLLVVIIAALDRIAVWLKAHPGALLALTPIGLWAAWTHSPDFVAFDHAARVFGDMLPPHLSHAALTKLPQQLWETIWMALVGTVAAGALALSVALPASRKLAPVWLHSCVRRACELMRTIPEVVWGLVLVATVGIGPIAGAWALGLHSFGSLVRLFADALDCAPDAPQRALRSTGAGTLAVMCYATLPLARGPMLTHLLFRLEWNMRMATVLGLIGAGGVGQALFEAQQLFFYQQTLAYVLVTAVLVLVTDHLSSRLRARVRQASQQDLPAAPFCLVAGRGLAS